MNLDKIEVSRKQIKMTIAQKKFLDGVVLTIYQEFRSTKCLT